MKAFSKFTNIGALRIEATAPVPITIGIIGTIADSLPERPQYFKK
jgi:hypothetical protein